MIRRILKNPTSIVLRTIMMNTTLPYKGKTVPVTMNDYTHDDINVVTESTPFKQWMSNMNNSDEMNLKSVHIQQVDEFKNKSIGFVKINADVTVKESKDGKEIEQKIPGIAFLRGGAVSILIVLSIEETKKKYVVLVNQARVPIGSQILELPAGMIDKEGNIKSKAVEELEEETGIKIKDDDLVDMLVENKMNNKGLFTSPGGQDEFLKFYLYEKQVSNSFIEEINNKQTGLRDHGEVIQLSVVPFEQAHLLSPDIKVSTSLFLYSLLRKDSDIKNM
ncbi:ADP-sugar diphosphatase [Acrasis kona]|uniref:ADP-sugar diphosphatase n=1 Tax=Acrasis kona TaxID=1008807 RepID=A0AAW2ZHL9_9EUKA